MLLAPLIAGPWQMRGVAMALRSVASLSLFSYTTPMFCSETQSVIFFELPPEGDRCSLSHNEQRDWQRATVLPRT